MNIDLPDELIRKAIMEALVNPRGNDGGVLQAVARQQMAKMALELERVVAQAFRAVLASGEFRVSLEGSIHAALVKGAEEEAAKVGKAKAKRAADAARMFQE